MAKLTAITHNGLSYINLDDVFNFLDENAYVRGTDIKNELKRGADKWKATQPLHVKTKQQEDEYVKGYEDGKADALNELLEKLQKSSL